MKKEAEGTESSEQRTVERRAIRSKYLELKNLISDQLKDALTKVDSDKFNTIFNQVESIHQHVRKPREQVADAEALLDMASTLESSVKSSTNERITPADFVTVLLREFGVTDSATDMENGPNTLDWHAVGSMVSEIFRNAPGCSTMIGPMDIEPKQRKVRQYRQRTRPTNSILPDELVGKEEEGKNDTDKNMSTMFDIIRRLKSVRLEYLVFNRVSFAQTVENIFALSFLVKDGRTEITVNEFGHHLVSPRNAPTVAAILSGEISYNHFVFRLDYEDWKLMANAVEAGEELMPHRCSDDTTEGSANVIHRRYQKCSFVVKEQNLANVAWGKKKARTGFISDRPVPDFPPAVQL